MKTDELAVKINKLWTQFNLVDENLVGLVRDEKTNSNYTVFNYQTLQNEYQRCIALKRMFHRDYIEELRDHIKSLWAEYFYDQEDRADFQKLMDEPSITDELYDKHNKYLDDLLAYGKRHEDLFTNLNAWIKTWEAFVNFDVSCLFCFRLFQIFQAFKLLESNFQIDYSDPNRFKAKDYSALYEQKERKLYSVKFPKLEALLFKEQKLYKQQEKREFIIEGETVINFIKKKKAFHDEYKKTMRKERVS